MKELLNKHWKKQTKLENIMLKLDGGIDLNGTRPASTNVGLANADSVNRDNPPALSWDMFLGDKQSKYWNHVFQYFQYFRISRPQAHKRENVKQATREHFCRGPGVLLSVRKG